VPRFLDELEEGNARELLENLSRPDGGAPA
jgi:hypothetical protein